MENTSCFVPLDQILCRGVVDGADSLDFLTDLEYLKMDRICTIKSVGESMFYRIDEDKTLKWLQKKVVNMAEILKNNALAGKRKGLSSSFIAPDAVVTKKRSSAAAKDRARVAMEKSFGIISEYVASEWVSKLRKTLKTTSAGASATSQPAIDTLDATSSPAKRGRWDNDIEDSNLKFTHTVGQCKDVGTQVKAKRKKTVATTKVQPKGMKSLFSYFSKKSK